MRHGWTIAPAVLMLVFSLPKIGRSAEPMVLDDHFFGTRIAPIFLLLRPDVQADLKLSPKQESDAKMAAQQLHRKALGLRVKPGPGVVAARGAIDAEMTRWLAANLDDRQLGRLEQIDLQWEGVWALHSRPFIAEYLNLSPDQRLAIDRHFTARRNRRAQGKLAATEDADLSHKALATLSKSQTALWERLLGIPCRFSFLQKAASPPNQVSQRGLGEPAPTRR